MNRVVGIRLRARTTSRASIGPAASVTWLSSARQTPRPAIAPKPQSRPALWPVRVVGCVDNVRIPPSTTAIRRPCRGDTRSPKKTTVTMTVTASHADAALVTTETVPRCKPV